MRSYTFQIPPPIETFMTLVSLACWWLARDTNMVWGLRILALPVTNLDCQLNGITESWIEVPRACSSEIEGLTQSPLTSKIHIWEWGHWGSSLNNVITLRVLEAIFFFLVNRKILNQQRETLSVLNFANHLTAAFAFTLGVCSFRIQSRSFG